MSDEKKKPRLEDLPFGFKSQTLVRNLSKLKLIKNILFRETTVAEKLNQ